MAANQPSADGDAVVDTLNIDWVLHRGDQSFDSYDRQAELFILLISIIIILDIQKEFVISDNIFWISKILTH